MCPFVPNPTGVGAWCVPERYGAISSASFPYTDPRLACIVCALDGGHVMGLRSRKRSGATLLIMFPEVSGADLPWVTTDQMREVDRVMIEDLGIELIQMMENAGRNLADLAVGRFHPGSVMVLAGTGGNGGGAMVAARHLANRGVDVTVAITDPERLRQVPRHQFEILQRMGIDAIESPRKTDLVIDGLIGYSLSGDPTGRAAELIEWCSGFQVLSLDAPSGLDTTTGELHNPHVQAAATLTLAAPKEGLTRGRGSRRAIPRRYLCPAGSVRRPRLRFVGWSGCSPGREGSVRVSFRTSGPAGVHPSGVGESRTCSAMRMDEGRAIHPHEVVFRDARQDTSLD